MRISTVIPCYNEEATIGRVVADFKLQLPEARIIVFDNNSTDATAERARAAGAEVLFEARKGKGFVVRRMFEDIDADIYVMVDGDNTYPSQAVRKLIEPILAGRADMVVGSRLHRASNSTFHPVNRLGNNFFAGLFRIVFGCRLTDILSGYRAFSRAFAREVRLFGGGFEVEAELTVKSLQHGIRIEEVPVDLVPRPADSHSKIRIVRDGIVILSTILALVRDYKPLTTFGSAGGLLVIGGLAPVVIMALGRFPFGPFSRTEVAVFCGALEVLGSVLIAAGLILHSVRRHFQESTSRLTRIERVLDDNEGTRAANPPVHARRNVR